MLPCMCNQFPGPGLSAGRVGLGLADGVDDKRTRMVRRRKELTGGARLRPKQPATDVARHDQHRFGRVKQHCGQAEGMVQGTEENHGTLRAPASREPHGRRCACPLDAQEGGRRQSLWSHGMSIAARMGRQLEGVPSEWAAAAARRRGRRLVRGREKGRHGLGPTSSARVDEARGRAPAAVGKPCSGAGGGELAACGVVVLRYSPGAGSMSMLARLFPCAHLPEAQRMTPSATIRVRKTLA